MDIQLNSATQGFLAELEARPNVVGVILFGSWARGNNRVDSDVDLLIIVTEGFKRTVEYRDTQAFEIIYTTAESLVEFWENNKDDCAELWSIAKPLYDKDGTLQKLEAQATQILKAGKPAMNDDSLRQLRFDAEDQLRYVEATIERDVITANMLLTNKVFLLTELFFDVRQRWTPPPKQRLAQIETLDKSLHDLLVNFYRDALPIAERLILARQMIPLVFNDSH